MKLDAIQLLLLYGITAITFFVIDLIWIGGYAKGFYANHVGHLMGERVNWAAALIFYGVYIGGILLFVLIPALQSGSSVMHVMVMGGLLGLFAYSTFDLTALALFKEWSVIVTVVDIAWGAFLTASTASITHWITQNLLKLS